MKIKTKIQIALLGIFLLFATLAGINGYYLDKIAKDSAKMMNENYRSLDYTHQMSLALEDVDGTMKLENANYLFKRKKLADAFSRFELYLNLQNYNTTNKVEADITNRLTEDYEEFKKNTLTQLRQLSTNQINFHMQALNIRTLLDQVYQVNKENIFATNQRAHQIISKVTTYLIILGITFFILAVISMFYLPAYFADPIKNMTASINQIANQNYHKRLEIKSQDEFGTMVNAFNTMAAKLEEYNQYNLEQLITEKSRIDKLISKIKAAIIGLDPNGHIVFLNQNALRLIQDTENTPTLQSHIKEINHPFFLQIAKDLQAGNLQENNQYQTIEIQKQNNFLYFSPELVKVTESKPTKKTNSSLGYGWFIILRNITTLKRENIAKTNFMANLSHELKTPLSAIDMSAELIVDQRLGPVNEEQKSLSTTIKQNTKRMVTMVNEILEMAKLESGNIIINKKQTQASMIVKGAISSVNMFLLQKDIKIISNIEPNLPYIEIDHTKTTDVLVNLLTNAIKYTETQGTILINVNRFIDHINFEVIDFGPGISKENQKKIFKKFHRVNNGKTQGTGLGLAIAKELIEAQGGSIRVHSVPNNGSTFGFLLPI